MIRTSNRPPQRLRVRGAGLANKIIVASLFSSELIAIVGAQFSYKLSEALSIVFSALPFYVALLTILYYAVKMDGNDYHKVKNAIRIAVQCLILGLITRLYSFNTAWSWFSLYMTLIIAPFSLFLLHFRLLILNEPRGIRFASPRGVPSRGTRFDPLDDEDMTDINGLPVFNYRQFHSGPADMMAKFADMPWFL